MKGTVHAVAGRLWDFWIDRGGTFTDVVARRPDGTIVTHKVLSEGVGGEAAVDGMRHLLGLGPDEPIPATLVGGVRMGTTVATNALLQRRGEPTVFVVTAGFADALRIGTQHRPEIFARHIVRPELVHERVVEVDCRVAADGTRLRSLDAADVRRDLAAAHADGLRSVAVATLHGWAHPADERAIAAIARDVGFTQVSTSHEVSPLLRLVPRGETTVVDAYLSPVLRRRVDQVADVLVDVPLHFMQSNGGLVEASRFRGKDAILSGPAGGVVAMARVAAAAGLERIIGFDMGGTSTDVSHFAGTFERQLETHVGGVALRSPMLAVHTVAAGGGSILDFDGARYRVGPMSAGADPGPTAYRRGGPLTVTDANVMLGRIHADAFPTVFGPGGDQPLDVAAVRSSFADLAERITSATGDDRTPEQVADGFRDIAVANMANAIRKISVQRGHDVTRYALVTFGGAGGQHACAVADDLGMDTVLVHPLAGVLSAYGMGLADVTALREQAVEQVLSVDLLDHLSATVDTLEAAARDDLVDVGGNDSVTTTSLALLKVSGSDTPLPVELAGMDQMVEAFEDAYRRQFSFLPADADLVVAAVQVEVTAAAGADERVLAATRTSTPPDDDVADMGPVDMLVAGQWRSVPLLQRASLAAGDEVAGPAIIAEDTGTTIVEDGWQAMVTELDHLLLTRVAARPGRADVGTEVDPVLLEVFNNLFMAVAEQMGVALRRTAHSINIRERLDFSCAVFDADANLVANAPHIPVHLGSMGESIRVIAQANADRMRPGDVYCLNNPYRGGTHLPDVTVVTPVFDPSGTTVWFYVASRGHHAEIGGTTPGSMPADSTHIDHEGVLLDNWLLVRDGHLRRAATTAVLADAPHPSRNPAANVADLAAKVAANEKGATELRAMVEHFSLDVVHAYMDHVRANAAAAIRSVIDDLDGGHCRYELDDGAVIEVAVSVDHDDRTAHVDFTGTSQQRPGNANAPSSVAMAAVLYVFRTLVDDTIPLNAGCLEPITVTIPDGCMLSPRHPAAVVAGNVETSQAVTGALYRALAVQAEGSGTMNNVTFGNDEHQYYETVASGSGAGDGFHGTDVVQTHMTNSRLTDPEVLELRHPVRVESFAVRTGSGGDGRWRGGDGAVRRLRFLAPMTVSVLASHRLVAPYGMAGGQPGALGHQWVEHPDGSRTEVAGRDAVEVAVDDVFVIETPGGGGWGPPG